MNEPAPTAVSYHPSVEAWDGWPAFLEHLIDTTAPGSVCDVGGGRNPTFSAEYVQDHGFAYTLLDIDPTELERARGSVDKVVADIAAPSFEPPRQYDLVLSRMLAEHVGDGGQFHRNVFRLLAPGGIAVHFFPTLFSTPFVVNRLMPERLADVVLDAIAPRDRSLQGKFPARYSWCRGPTARQMQRLQGIGYQIVEYRGYFGHAYYGRLPVVRELHRAKSRLLLRHPVAPLTSYACVVLRKPDRSPTDGA